MQVVGAVADLVVLAAGVRREAGGVEGFEGDAAIGLEGGVGAIGDVGAIGAARVLCLLQEMYDEAESDDEDENGGAPIEEEEDAVSGERGMQTRAKPAQGGEAAAQGAREGISRGGGKGGGFRATGFHAGQGAVRAAMGRVAENFDCFLDRAARAQLRRLAAPLEPLDPLEALGQRPTDAEDALRQGMR